MNLEEGRGREEATLSGNQTIQQDVKDIWYNGHGRGNNIPLRQSLSLA